MPARGPSVVFCSEHLARDDRGPRLVVLDLVQPIGTARVPAITPRGRYGGRKVQVLDRGQLLHEMRGWGWGEKREEGEATLKRSQMAR